MDAPPNDGQHPLPTTAADARREALTQALLEVLTERRAHSSDTESEISTFSDWAFCAAQLAEYIETDQQGVGDAQGAAYSIGGSPPDVEDQHVQ